MTSLYIISYDNITHLLPCVCRCFLTEQTEGGGRLAAPSPPAACNRFLKFDLYRDVMSFMSIILVLVILAMLLMLTKLVSTYLPAAYNRFLRFDLHRDEFHMDDVFHIIDVCHIGIVVDVDKL